MAARGVRTAARRGEVGGLLVARAAGGGSTERAGDNTDRHDEQRYASAHGSPSDEPDVIAMVFLLQRLRMAHPSYHRSSGG